ncbi:hypothetical protein PENSPDRAFT_690069 [Peniophora sp. CONT]|nr:hypothetical protein PENSPDRAFT_690069 [Peniophora sp. CONT]
MRDQECRRAPSRQFLSILRDTGLEKWLVPGSDFSYLPAPDTAEGRCLSHTVYMSRFDGTFADVLRALARQVDMGAGNGDESHETIEKLESLSPLVVDVIQVWDEPSEPLSSGTCNLTLSPDSIDYQRTRSPGLEQVIVDFTCNPNAGPSGSGNRSQ